MNFQQTKNKNEKNTKSQHSINTLIHKNKNTIY